MSHSYYKIPSLYIGKHSTTYTLNNSTLTINDDIVEKWNNRSGFMHIFEQCMDSIYLLSQAPNSFKLNKNCNSSFLGYSDAFINVRFFDEKQRNLFYKNGFVFNKQKYVRYKRSASSAKKGNCLFILDKHVKLMSKWNNCNINPKKINSKSLLTSWEAYSALTLSGLLTSFSIPAESIMIMRDYQSIFNDSGVEIYLENNHVDSRFSNNIEIKNTLWDGECLLDESIFTDIIPSELADKSMLLLRNRFFKSCGFRTKLQRWFNDNNITNTCELNGYTLATDISDIKIVFTESSLKFLKFCSSKKPNENDFSTYAEYNNAYIKYLGSALNEWLIGLNKHTKEATSNLNFGIVKSDNPSIYMNGKMVHTNYQLLNTLGLSEHETIELLAPTLEYLENSKKNPLFHRFFLKSSLNFSFLNDSLKDCDEISDYETPYQEYSDEASSPENNMIFIDNTSLYNYRHRLVSDFLSITDDFSGTKICQEVRSDINKIIDNRVRKGRFLIPGTYATLFGNPIEFLYATIHKDYCVSELDYFLVGNSKYTGLYNNEIHCSFFDDENTHICGARSPHITMGNLFLGLTKKNSFIDKYFSLSPQIVCINSINHNILQKLNGADFDSDTMLLTKHPIIVNAVERQKNLFPVPVNKIDEIDIKDNKNEKIYEKLTKIDTDISKNNIGSIINRSQQLNSILWNTYPLICTVDSKQFQEFISLYDTLFEIIDEKMKKCILELGLHRIVDSNDSQRVYNDIKNALKEIQCYITKTCDISNTQYALYKQIANTYNIVRKNIANDITITNRAISNLAEFALEIKYGEYYTALEQYMYFQSDYIYNYICIFEVLSNIEIDKAKRTYLKNTNSEFKKLDCGVYRLNVFNWTVDEYGDPAFRHITNQSKKYTPTCIRYLNREFSVRNNIEYNTTISYIYKNSKNKPKVENLNKSKVKLCDLINKPNSIVKQTDDVILGIITLAAYYQLKIRSSHYIIIDDNNVPDYDLISQYIKECFDAIQKKIINPKNKKKPEEIIYSLLMLIDKHEEISCNKNNTDPAPLTIINVLKQVSDTRPNKIGKCDALKKLIDSILNENNKKENPIAENKLPFNETCHKLLLGALWYTKKTSSDTNSILYDMIATKYLNVSIENLHPNPDHGDVYIYGYRFERITNK